jgi:hypothetical protein
VKYSTGWAGCAPTHHPPTTTTTTIRPPAHPPTSPHPPHTTRWGSPPHCAALGRSSGWFTSIDLVPLMPLMRSRVHSSFKRSQIRSSSRRAQVCSSPIIQARSSSVHESAQASAQVGLCSEKCE